jgi:hypothetical protein
MISNIQFIFSLNRLEAFINEDLVGHMDLAQGNEGIYIKYSFVSEYNQGQGIGLKMYQYLIHRCKEDQIKLFRMKNPSSSAQNIWIKLQSLGVRFIDRKDLMSTNQEIEVDLLFYQE